MTEYPREDGYLPKEYGDIMKQLLAQAAGAAEDADGQVKLAYDALADLVRSRERNPVAIMETVVEQVLRLAEAREYLNAARTELEDAEALRKANSEKRAAALERHRERE